MVLEINGVDITPYIALGGVKWSRNDVDGANAGRMESGLMERDRKATKYRFDITCRPVTAEEQAIILQLIQPVFFDVTFTDPLTNAERTSTFYSNNFPSTFLQVMPNGTEFWSGLAFPLIEQ